MVYLIYAILLLIGIVIVFFIDHASCVMVKATVLESCEQVIKKNDKVSEIKIEHTLSFKLGEEEKNIIVNCIPIRETNGTVVDMKLDKKTLEPAEKAIKAVLPATFAMLSAMLFCLYMFLADRGVSSAITFSGFELSASQFAFVFPVLLGLVLCGILLSDLFCYVLPGIIKVSGNYEGCIHSGNFHRMTKYYSLWYGEFRQHARCIGGALKIPDKETAVTLFFNTKTGTVRRQSDVVRNIILGAVLFVLIILYIVFHNKLV